MNTDITDFENLDTEELNDKYIDLKKKKNKYKLQVIELQNQNKLLLEKRNINKNNNNNYMASIIQPYFNKLLKTKDNDD